MLSDHRARFAAPNRLRGVHRGLCSFLLATLLSADPASALIRTRHVVIVVIDGGRYSETLGDPTLANHPRMGRDLAAIGARPARFDNLGITNTVPGMSAIVCGAIQDLANDGTERPHLPTLGEYLRKLQATPDSLVRVVAMKGKLNVLGYSDHPDYGAAYGAVTHAGFATDMETFAFARAEMLQYKPTYLLVHFGEPDVYGHALNWPAYLGALHLCDSLVWQLWTDIQSDAELGGRTTLFVTNDHGRHDDFHGGFQNHGDACDGCRHIMVLMAGPDNFTGYTSGAHHDQRAIARTAGYLLGVPMPLAAGAVMDDLLLEPSQPLAVPGGRGPARGPGIAVVPNPTRAGVQVRLAAGDGLEPRVEVLDAGGRRVATLARATADGPAWRWDGRDASGHRAPPGTYLVRVREGDRVRLARVVKLE